MDHFVHLYQEVDVLAGAVAEYIGTGLHHGEAAVVIATPEHCTAFLERLDVREESLHVLDAERAPWRASWRTPCRSGSASTRSSAG